MMRTPACRPASCGMAGRASRSVAVRFRSASIDRVADGYSPANGPDRILANWAIMLLPHLEQNNLYKAFNQSLPVDDPSNAAARRDDFEFHALPQRSLQPAALRAGVGGRNGHGTQLRAGELCGKLRTAAGLLPVAVGLHEWQ